MQEIVVPVGESAKKLENYLKKQFPIGYVRKLFRKERRAAQRPEVESS
jgi:hypothetical protein